jgi:mono/diheme cytochrome c family protein
MKPMTRLGCAFLLAASLTELRVPAVHAADAADSALAQRGNYLAIAGDCGACHTAPSGKAMAGGLPLATPFGPIYATNITPSKAYGIGNYTLAQFANALRKGVRADGAYLYPAMPYTSYALLSDDDVKALYSYFMSNIVAVDSPAPKTKLPFPFNIRLSIAAWNFLFLDEKSFATDPSKSPEWNRGAYLVRGLAHCGDCHTPRNILMAVEPSRDLGGGIVDGWDAPNITPDETSGIGGWSQEDVVGYLRTGRTAGKGQAAGSMAEAIDLSFRYLTDSDLRAITVYLKSIPSIHNAADTRAPYQWGAPASELTRIRGVPLPADPNEFSGAQLYDAYCATCHGSEGQGSFDRNLPSLFHDTALGRTSANNLVLAILQGVRRQPDTPNLLMPGFSDTLSDRQITNLGKYLIEKYGNPNAQISIDQVADLRSGKTSSFLLDAARIGMAVAVLAAAAVIVFFFFRRRRGGITHTPG